MGGLDALLSIVQMPPGVPGRLRVARTARKNAAILAAKILGQGGGYRRGADSAASR